MEPGKFDESRILKDVNIGPMPSQPICGSPTALVCGQKKKTKERHFEN